MERFRAAATGSALRLSIYDEIGYWGVRAVDVQRALAQAGPSITAIELAVNSPGGSAQDGIAIYNMLSTHPASVSVRVEGFAASAASVIAMAGDEILVGENALMMIHEASGRAFGPAHELEGVAKILRKINEGMITVYAARTGMDRDAVAKLVEAETWFTGAEAVAAGFADSLIAAKTKPGTSDTAGEEAPEEDVAARSVVSAVAQWSPGALEMLGTYGHAPTAVRRALEQVTGAGEREAEASAPPEPIKFAASSRRSRAVRKGPALAWSGKERNPWI